MLHSQVAEVITASDGSSNVYSTKRSLFWVPLCPTKGRLKYFSVVLDLSSVTYALETNPETRLSGLKPDIERSERVLIFASASGTRVSLHISSSPMYSR
jgi:hypothetical protein